MNTSIKIEKQDFLDILSDYYTHKNNSEIKIYERTSIIEDDLQEKKVRLWLFYLYEIYGKSITIRKENYLNDVDVEEVLNNYIGGEYKINSFNYLVGITKYLDKEESFFEGIVLNIKKINKSRVLRND